MHRYIERYWRTAVALAVMMVMFVWITHSTYFTVGHIYVKGATLASTQDILSASGVRPGANIWLIFTRTVRNRLKGYPSIEDVHVEHHFPKTVVIAIKERKPVAVIQAAGRTVLVDASARVIADVNAPPIDLPGVVMAAAAPESLPAPGKVVSDPLLLAGLRCLRLRNDKQFALPVTRAFIDQKRTICLNVTGYGKVIFGQPTDLGPKLAMLQAIASRSPALMRKAEIVDLQNPDVPAYRPRPEPPAPTQGQGVHP